VSQPKKTISIYIEKLNKNAKLPTFAHVTDAGADICSTIRYILHPGEIQAIPTGIQVQLPRGYFLDVRPRSGLALKGITLVNAPGTVDADYRDEIRVILINLGEIAFTVEKGMRIAQLLLRKVEPAEYIEVEKISKENDRNGGFGSTGLH